MNMTVDDIAIGRERGKELHHRTAVDGSIATVDVDQGKKCPLIR